MRVQEVLIVDVERRELELGHALDLLDVEVNLVGSRGKTARHRRGRHASRVIFGESRGSLSASTLAKQLRIGGADRVEAGSRETYCSKKPSNSCATFSPVSSLTAGISARSRWMRTRGPFAPPRGARFAPASTASASDPRTVRSSDMGSVRAPATDDMIAERLFWGARVVPRAVRVETRRDKQRRLRVAAGFDPRRVSTRLGHFITRATRGEQDVQRRAYGYKQHMRVQK